MLCREESGRGSGGESGSVCNCVCVCVCVYVEKRERAVIWWSDESDTHTLPLSSPLSHDVTSNIPNSRLHHRTTLIRPSYDSPLSLLHIRIHKHTHTHTHTYLSHSLGRSRWCASEDIIE